jgi:hypothetical protein
MNAQPQSASNQSSNGGGFGGMPGPSPFETNASPFAPKAPQHNQEATNPSGISNNPAPPQVTNSDNGVIPSARTRQEGASPLDKYMRKPDNGNNPATQQQAPQGQPAPAPTPAEKNFFDYTTKDYQGVYGKNDFVGESITPEIMTAIQQGDVQAFKNILNTAIANGASQSSYAVSQVAKAGVGQEFKNFSKGELAEILKGHTLDQQWAGVDSSVLKHPQVEPMARSKMQEFRTQYPEASEQEIVQATTEFFQDFMKVMSGANQQQEQQANPPTRGGLGKFFNS